MWYYNLAKQGLAAAEKMAQDNDNKTPYDPHWEERMRERERKAAQWWNLYNQLKQLDPGDFVGRWLLQSALNRLESSFVSESVSATGVGGYHTYTDSAGQTHRVYYSGETEPRKKKQYVYRIEPRKKERYVYRVGDLPYPEWVKNLGLVAEIGALGMPRALAPLGAQASLTPSQMPGLLGMLALASIKHPAAEKLPQTIRRRLPKYQPLMPGWGQYQQAIKNLPSLWEEYQRLSQKLFPKTYSVRPRWATAYQR